MSLQNFFLSRLLKSRQRASMKLSPQARFSQARKFLARDFSRISPSISVRPDQIAGVKVEWVAPKALALDARSPICLYLHGGAFVMGSPNSHRDMAAQLAQKAGVRMLMVDYRLAPEHPYPAAHEDVMTVYRALLAQGVPAQRLFIAGDSAGGNLALAAAQSIRDAELPAPRGLVLFSPWLDLTQQSASITSRAAKDVMLNRQLLDEVVPMYAPGLPAHDPRISPLFGNLAGLPPCLTVVSQSEILLDDALQLHQKLQAAGGDSRCLQWAHTPHAFVVMARLLPEARDALDQTAQFMVRLAPS
jgi:acetyl esterase/lipase